MAGNNLDEAMHRTQIFLPRDLHYSLKKEAESGGITVSELIRNMLNRQLHVNSRTHTERGIQVLLNMADAR